MSVQFYWIPGPLANYGTTENGFKGEVRVVSVADFQLVTHANEVQAQEIHSLRADIVDLIAEVARLQRLIQMASDTGDLYERKLDAHETAIGSLRSRLAEAERNGDTLWRENEVCKARLDEAVALIKAQTTTHYPGNCSCHFCAFLAKVTP